MKKFGVLENNNLVYDQITTSYPMVLPTEHYTSMIQPRKADTKDRWFVRPHHIETLTTHVKSVNDDILNTRYYSHYENPEDPNKKKPEIEEAIGGLEGQIKAMKDRLRMFQMANGTYDPDKEADLQEDEEIQKWARRKFDKFIDDRDKPVDRKQLLVDIFEEVLFEKRRLEREM